MDSETISEAWDVCEVEELEQFNGTRIGPAVFEPQMEGEFVFADRLGDEEQELWEQVNEMEGVAWMMEPLDGYLRTTAYVVFEEGEVGADISFRSYSNRIKIGPAEGDCPFEAFEHFINEFEENVCELEFLGGLEAMEDR